MQQALVSRQNVSHSLLGAPAAIIATGLKIFYDMFKSMEILRAKRIDIKKIAGLLREGGVIICPTDTVYGLLADATNQKAVDKIFKIKKRPRNKPIPIFVKDIKMAKRIARVSPLQEKFLKSVWPGDTTVVLKPRVKMPMGIGKVKKEIGLRIPDHKIVSRLLSKINFPLTGTSANISGQPSSTKIKDILSQFKNQKYLPDLVIDEGNLPKNKPSTIIDLTHNPPKIIRM
jgi:L-threonylcarbamoyladenylate synthase